MARSILVAFAMGSGGVTFCESSDLRMKNIDALSPSPVTCLVGKHLFLVYLFSDGFDRDDQLWKAGDSDHPNRDYQQDQCWPRSYLRLVVPMSVSLGVTCIPLFSLEERCSLFTIFVMIHEVGRRRVGMRGCS
ncbi:hypothetical protein AG1IA_01647 [Rhizoctonia solani AG-1 IA]|uniref:Uncharacterized protein n=1 Tax=Thanatephorus cucumeris (strain AG1-IA) TaxID=983506 RepID=L8X6S5_THACA|nr:hypothetical protein AG1IA_01647 [Rhizoctonia solani AG-1 IA]